MNVRAKVELKKKRTRENFEKRKDHQMMCYSDNKFEKFKLKDQLHLFDKKMLNQTQESICYHSDPDPLVGLDGQSGNYDPCFITLQSRIGRQLHDA